MTHRSWSKGFTKDTHPSVRKISETMKRKKIDNFASWRERMKTAGKIKSKYLSLKRNGDLAELIGVILGDGHICRFPRCDCLRITANSDNKGFVRRYARLVETVFNKKPRISKVRASRAATITIYERHISRRLGIPCGSRHDLQYILPAWIRRDKRYVIKFLRGLYEAEGSHSIHLPTCTYKLQFSNANMALLDLVFELVSKLGFHPHKSYRQIQVSRKADVQSLKNLIEFRHY